MKLIDDTLKTRGKWSVGRLTMLVSFIYVILSCSCSTIKSGTTCDVPTNWVLLIGMMYGINKTAQCAISRTNTPMPSE